MSDIDLTRDFSFIGNFSLKKCSEGPQVFDLPINSTTDFSILFAVSDRTPAGFQIGACEGGRPSALPERKRGKF
jgi:hypothetical protein